MSEQFTMVLCGTQKPAIRDVGNTLAIANAETLEIALKSMRDDNPGRYIVAIFKPQSAVSGEGEK